MQNRYDELQNKRIRKYVLLALAFLLIIFAFLLFKEMSDQSKVKISQSQPTATEVLASNMMFINQNQTAAPTQEPVEEAATEAPTEVPTPRPSPTPRPTEIVPLRRGNKGDEVRALQQRLVELRYLQEGDVDGNYGKGTMNAVKRFQMQNGLAPDGVAGRETIQKLYSDDAR